MSEQNYQHWRWEVDANAIVWLTLDRHDSSVNALSRAVLQELGDILTLLASGSYAGIIFQSAKRSGFSPGADISQFTHLKTEDEAYDLIRQAQLVFDQIENLNIPTVAMISGVCLGGGYEFALACRYRVAEESDTTHIGLPEVKLGIHPGWGGTVRLPRLIGAPSAMQIILQGLGVNARKAKRMGMVDACVPLRELKRAAEYFILKQPKPHQPSFLQRMTQMPGVRSILGKVFTRKLAEHGVQMSHYPAPFAVVDNWVRYGSKDDAMVQEARSIAKLMLTPTARNLVRAFFLQTRLKGMGKGVAFKPSHVHVIGAGTMGGDIAAWCVYKGFYVTLEDQSPEKIAPAVARAHALFEKKYRKPHLVQAAMDRFQPDVAGRGIVRADVVIEAVFEDLSVKQAIFQKIESQLKAGAIMATNTSSIPLESIGSVLKQPERLVGIHFFNPVAKMPLVEVVSSPKTSEQVAESASAFVTQLGRLPLPVLSRPGFLVNRVLMPYLMEAMRMLEENMAMEDIDHAALMFGMPMGPVALADKVGLDVCLSVAENLTKAYGGEVPERLKTLVSQGKLGVKTGEGFYRYQKGKPLLAAKPETNDVSQDVTDRLILSMVNEAVACLDEKIVSESDLLDAGMIFGTGFAPFRGGPIQYARTRGAGDCVVALNRLQEKFGDRFKPKAGWKPLSDANGSGAHTHKGAHPEVPSAPHAASKQCDRTSSQRESS